MAAPDWRTEATKCALQHLRGLGIASLATINCKDEHFPLNIIEYRAKNILKDSMRMPLTGFFFLKIIPKHRWEHFHEGSIFPFITEYGIYLGI